MKDKYYYEYEWDRNYCYPNSYVLRNKLNITNQAELEEAERAITSLKMSQAVSMGISGDFDFEHLKAIHKFLFEDIYEWAGKVRNVNISKDNQFCRFEYIDVQAEKLLNKLKSENYLKDCSNVYEIGKRLAYYLSEINVIHPFREGNGRTQRLFIELLAKNAGYTIDFMKITKDEMLEASVRSYACDYELMEHIITNALSD